MKQQPKQTTTKVKRVKVTPELKALYYSLLTGKTNNITQDEQQLIVAVFDERFPLLKKESRKLTKKKHWWSWSSTDVVWFVLFLTIIAIGLLFGCTSPVEASVETDLQAASGLQQWETDLTQFASRLSDEQAEMWEKLSHAEKRVVMANNMQRLAEHDRDSQQGRVDAARQSVSNAEYETKKARDYNAALMAQQTAQQAPQTPQLQKAYGYANAPQRSAKVLTDTQTSKEWFVADGVLRPASKTTNTYIVQPAPVVVAPAKSDALFEIDEENMKSRLLITDSANAHIVTALEKSIEQSGDNFAEKLKYADTSEKREFELEYFKLVRGFVLWGLFASIPFMAALFFMGKGIAKGVNERSKLVHDYRLRELEAAEHAVYDRVGGSK